MSKNSLIIIIIVVFVALSIFVSTQDSSNMAVNINSTESTKVQKQEFNEEDEQVKELKKQAGVSSVESSQLYKTRCASCHGYSGEGVEKLGTKISGKTEKQILKNLEDFKAGKVPNTLMTGLLMNTSDDELKILAGEIAKF